MFAGFELVETITKRTDGRGSLDLISHIDKTSNSTAPSNRDFLYEVSYSDNPSLSVVTSNTVTVRHLIPKQGILNLSSDITTVNDGVAVLTLSGSNFVENKKLLLKLFRRVKDEAGEYGISTVVETDTIFTDETGFFTIDIHEDYTSNINIVHDDYNESHETLNNRLFFGETVYETLPDIIITSNEVIITHIKVRPQ